MPKGRKYMVSVIIPIYNVGEYLDESIQSIIDQDIGFEDNIELILVNDGSTDNSVDVCKKYESKYDNVTLINKANGGVSSARNAGLEVATSDFVAFFDADDKLADDFYKLLLAQLSKHRDLPFAVGRTKKFDAESGYHATDGKFHRTRVIDLSETPHDIQTLQSPVLYRRSALEGVYFNESMTHSEDSEFVNRVLMMTQGKYAVVREAIYYYRRRKDESSATGVAKQRKTYYLSMVRLVDSLLSVAERELGGAVPRYVQYALLYQVGWRMRVLSQPDVLSPEEWMEYKDSLRRAIYTLDDEVIAYGSPSVRGRERRLIFAVKYASDPDYEYKKLELSDKSINKLRSELVFRVRNVDIKGGGVEISGFMSPYNPQTLGLDLTVKSDGKRVNSSSKVRVEQFMGDDIEVKTSVSFTLPVARSGVITVEVADESTVDTVPLVYSSSTGVKRSPLAYKRLSSDMFALCDKYKLFIFSGFNLQALKIAGSMAFRQTASRGRNFVRRILDKVYSLARAR